MSSSGSLLGRGNISIRRRGSLLENNHTRSVVGFTSWGGPLASASKDYKTPDGSCHGGGQRVHSIGPQKLDRASKLQRLRPSPLDGSFAGFGPQDSWTTIPMDFWRWLGLAVPTLHRA